MNCPVLFLYNRQATIQRVGYLDIGGYSYAAATIALRLKHGDLLGNRSIIIANEEQVLHYNVTTPLLNNNSATLHACLLIVNESSWEGYLKDHGLVVDPVKPCIYNHLLLASALCEIGLNREGEYTMPEEIKGMKFY